MFSWLSSSFGAVNAGLLGWAALIASPILIHLLSRRKFRTVHWAAMDFLFTADKKNRRRVQLENLLLMLLRCLIILLIALLIARPYKSTTDLTLAVGSGSGIERIVILDDSPSMEVSGTFDAARSRLVQFIHDLGNERSLDTFTLVLASDPEQPRMNSREIHSENGDLVIAKLESLQISDQAADLTKACQTVQQMIKSAAEDKNRIVYVVSDMRSRDWDVAGGDEEKKKANQLTDAVKTLADTSDGLYVVDVATDEVPPNLTVTGVTPLDQTLIAGVGTKVRVTVHNAGPTEASSVDVRLVVNDTRSPKQTIGTIPIGEERSVEFPYKFFDEGSVRLRAEIDSDAMKADDARYFAAHVREATEVLLVQEDLASDPRQAEIFYLRRQLEPKNYSSGFAVTDATESSLDTIDLEKFDVIYLCNLARLSEAQTKRLESYVADGGGLIVTLGDMVDEYQYNKLLYKDGKGLLPVELVAHEGVSDNSEWTNITADQPTHPAVDIYSGETAILARQVKIFRWWNTKPGGENVSVVASMTNPDHLPLLVEKPYGKGRVSVWTTSVDADWTNLPLDDSFAWVFPRNTEHVRRTRTSVTTQDIGKPIQFDFDAARYERTGRLVTPSKEQHQIQADPIVEEAKEEPKEVAATEGETETETPAETKPSVDPVSEGLKKPHRILYTDTFKRGFYDLTLKSLDGKAGTVLFARNIDATEGQLQRVDSEVLSERLGDNEKIQLVQEAGSLSLDASGTRTSYWRHVLIALLVVLAAEQSLAWYFGTRR